MEDDSELKNMEKFYGNLCKSSDKEFAHVEKKNTKYRNDNHLTHYRLNFGLNQNLLIYQTLLCSNHRFNH